MDDASVWISIRQTDYDGCFTKTMMKIRRQFSDFVFARTRYFEISRASTVEGKSIKKVKCGLGGLDR